MSLPPRTSLVLFATVTLATVWGAFGFLTVVRDVRVRVLLAPPQQTAVGVPIARLDGIRSPRGDFAPLPVEGDVLTEMAGLPVATAFDVFHAQDLMLRLSPRMAREFDRVDVGTSWPAAGDRLDPIVFDGTDWWVRVRFRDRDSDVERAAFLQVQGVPWGWLTVSLVWAVLQLGIFLLAGVSWWYRPFDPSARAFFYMAGTTLGAYVGALHWWASANSVFVLAPFAIYGFFLPAVSVHLALTFPRLTPVAIGERRLTTGLLYLGPTLTSVGLIAFLVYAMTAAGDPAGVERDRLVLWIVSFGVRVFAVIALAHYVAMVVVLAVGWRRSTGRVRASAGRLLAASAVTAVPIGYTVALAWIDRGAFAFDGFRWPMLFAAVTFSAGYLVGLGPAKLATLDAAAGRGSRYLLASGGLAAAFIVAVGLLLVAQSRFDRAAAAGGLVPAGVIATVFVVAVLLWLRDRAQHAIDRRFFRDKYQLDVTLGGVNRAFFDESDPRTVTRQMLASCRQALSVEYAALYRRGEDDAFELVTFDGARDRVCPPTIAAESGLVRALAEGGVRRSVAASASRFPSAQRVLKALDASAFFPLPGPARVEGFVATGRKPADTALSAEDLTLLDAVSHVLAAATGVHERFEVELNRRAETIGSLERQIDALRGELATTYIAEPAEESETDFKRDAVIGQGPAVREVLASAKKVAPSDTTVLIRGESGTGKELLAVSIHENSGRRDGPLVKVNCAALAPGVLESELFGHVRGAFTGADRDQPGRFRAADGGTLFLDEVGDIPLATQVKLLRALQERAVEPVGSHESVAVDVRVVTATNRDLEAMIAEGTFREDLFYRMNVVTLTLPPLRDRGEDLEELAVSFLHRSARETNRPVVGFAEDVPRLLARYPWPGNIRELRNVIERAVVLADGPLITVEDLPATFASLGEGRDRRPSPRRTVARSERTAVRNTPPVGRDRDIAKEVDGGSERDRLTRVLAECGGNKAAAARRLGIARSTLFSKLKKHGIG